MAITFVNKSAFASGTAALTVGAVASTQADDLILLFVESANENIATPTGYTQVTGSPVSTGTAAAIGGVRLAVFYLWATGADTTTSVADSGNHTTAIKIAYRGVDKTTPFDATPVTGIKTPASTSSSFPGITTATANAKIVHASGLDLDAASTATTGAATNANLTGITERHDQTISGGVGGGLVIIDGTKATAGATGNTTATVTSTIQVYLTLALREAPPAQTLTPTLYTNTGTLYEPTVDVGAVNLDAPPVENTSVFYAATVTATGGSQDLQPGLYENAQTFFAPTVGRGPVSLTATRYDNAQTFFTPTVGRGPVTLTATRYDNGQTFYAATVAVGAVTLTPARYDNAQTFYSSVVATGSAVLAPARYDNTNTFYAHTLTAGVVTLAPARLDNTNTFYAASIGAGASALLPSRVENTNQFYAPTVTPGVITLAPVRVENAQTPYAPSVAVGAVTLTADRFDNASAFYPPRVSDAPTQNITFPDWVEPGWVEPGWVAWPYINANQFFGAALTQSASIQTAGGGKYIRSDLPLQWTAPLPFADREARRAKRRRAEILLITP